MLCFFFSGGGLFAVRLYREVHKAELAATGKGILVYGAGTAGRTLAREIRTNPSLRLRVLGFIDDNPSLRSSRVMDVSVLGAGRDIPRIVERYMKREPNIEEVIIAMPSATGRQMQEAHANCRAAGVTCRTIPSIRDLLTGNYLTDQLRNISLEDLLGREQVRLEEERIQASIIGRSILVTGAAGSIGSELCRQISRWLPAKLVILDQSESGLYGIDRELQQKHPSTDIVPVVGDIRNLRSIEEVVRTHKIDSIYHAAAYKHVPMMEHHVVEAVENNILGTWNLVRVAQQYRILNFLMISSDKAVNPTSVMGATKRVAELIVSAVAGGAVSASEDRTKFVSVRFGNVLESSGSVVPTFRSQIAAGGPVTVTHPDMRRYFMSIREAVLLVLQASTMGKGSEIFVLDMGEPVRILDLAHNMIQLAGLVPDQDIEVQITGLRPGEKLFEEIMLDGENIVPTYHEKIRIFNGTTPKIGTLAGWLSDLESLVARRDSHAILEKLCVLVPEYELQGKKQSSARREIVRMIKPTSAGRKTGLLQ